MEEKKQRQEKAYTFVQPETCCLHVIDPQENLVAVLHDRENLLETIVLMIDCAKLLSLPIIANTQYRQGLGGFPELLEKKLEDVVQIDKVHFNCLASEATALYYDNLPSQITTSILVGAESHICIYQTALGLLKRGVTPWIVTDGVSARSLACHEAALNRLQLLGCTAGPAEMVIYEMLGKAGTEEFKKILPLIVNR